MLVVNPHYYSITVVARQYTQRRKTDLSLTRGVQRPYKVPCPNVWRLVEKRQPHNKLW